MREKEEREMDIYKIMCRLRVGQITLWPYLSHGFYPRRRSIKNTKRTLEQVIKVDAGPQARLIWIQAIISLGQW